MDINEAMALVKELSEDFDGSQSFFSMGPKTQEAIALLATDVERLRAALREIDKMERISSYERCPDCDYPHGCTRETGCLVMQRMGGTLVQKIVAKAMEERT